jgi:putative FmdB family regulatory protein
MFVKKKGSFHSGKTDYNKTINKTIKPDQEKHMPIFEYLCHNCKKEFERLVFTGDSQKIDCPECGSDDVKKKMSATSFMSGSGFGGCVTQPAKGFS